MFSINRLDRKLVAYKADAGNNKGDETNHAQHQEGKTDKNKVVVRRVTGGNFINKFYG